MKSASVRKTPRSENSNGVSESPSTHQEIGYAIRKAQNLFAGDGLFLVHDLKNSVNPAGRHKVLYPGHKVHLHHLRR
jgi:hypothetical protein